MQLGTKLACFIFCVSTSILITRDAAAETLNPTTSYTTLSASDVLAGKSTLHIHHHNGVHFKENSLHGVAREEGKYFVSLLFSKYGAQNKTLHRNELLDLFHHLGLNEQNGQDLVTRTVSEVDKQDSETRGLDVKGQELGEKQSRVLDSLLSNGDVSKRSIRHFHSKHTNCVTIKEILQAFHLENKDEITLTDFLYLSPAIIHQLDAQNCSHLSHNALDGLDNIQHVHNRSTVTSNGNGSISPKVWGYSFAAVLIISLVGLLGVAVIPIMQKVFYNHLLQFLVALAVGALMGDALLHLLPHAIGGSELSHNHEGSSLSHTGTIWKGLCGLMGIFFFFLMERVLTIITEANSKKKLKRKVKDSHYNAENFVGSKLSSHTKPDYQSSEEMTMIKSLKSYADEMHDDDIIENVTKVMEEESMMTNVKHGHSHHGHGHHDGPMPKSVASIAWMVILGDGIHNFSDGLAIGAAFANSVTGGFSTSIAVFCHELPHEIGDFAVLLRAGMSAKQAIVYNCVSSILCFIGMAIGVALGNISDVTLWIFACVGGIFIYIALVDMLPEMTSVETKQGENPFCHLLLQCSGMLAGSSIMLLIAIFEDDLLTALD